MSNKPIENPHKRHYGFGYMESQTIALPAYVCILLITYLSLFILPCQANSKEETVILTLDEAIAIALRDNREVLLNQEKLHQAKLEIEEAKSAFLPEINLNSTAARSRGLYRKDITNYSFQAGMKQYLYRGGKSVNTLKQARDEENVQAAVFDRAISDVILRVKGAFFAISLAKEFTRLNKTIFENAREHFETASSRYKKGEAAESDLLKAQYSVTSSQSLYEESIHQQESTEALLKNILYLEENAAVEIKGDFDYTQREVAIDQAILKALKMRPEIREYESRINADKASVEIAKAGNRPDIYASFDYYSRSTTSLTFSPSKGWQDYNLAGFTLSWPIFDGWATKYKVEEAINNLRQSQIIQAQGRADIATQVKESYLSLKSAISKLKPQEEKSKVYADNLKVTQERYKEGIASELDLKDAGLALLISQFNQKQAGYDYLLAEAKLDNAMGAR